MAFLNILLSNVFLRILGSKFCRICALYTVRGVCGVQIVHMRWFDDRYFFKFAQKSNATHRSFQTEKLFSVIFILDFTRETDRVVLRWKHTEYRRCAHDSAAIHSVSCRYSVLSINNQNLNGLMCFLFQKTLNKQKNSLYRPQKNMIRDNELKWFSFLNCVVTLGDLAESFEPRMSCQFFMCKFSPPNRIVEIDFFYRTHLKSLIGLVFHTNSYKCVSE